MNFLGTICNSTRKGCAARKKRNIKEKNIFMESRRKRQNFIENQQHLFINYLVVIDNSVYNIFLNQYGFFSDSFIANYIKIFFCQAVNGVSLKPIFLINNFILNYLD